MPASHFPKSFHPCLLPELHQPHCVQIELDAVADEWLLEDLLACAARVVPSRNAHTSGVDLDVRGDNIFTNIPLVNKFNSLVRCLTVVSIERSSRGKGA